VGTTIKALRAGGLLETSDEAICTLARVSADCLDEALAYGTEKLYAISGMMKAHLSICEALVGRTTAGGDSDGIAEFFTALAAAGDGVVTDGKGGVLWDDRWGPRPDGLEPGRFHA
jgi:hypothetical protein